jgi:hypothetical protein
MGSKQWHTGGPRAVRRLWAIKIVEADIRAYPASSHDMLYISRRKRVARPGEDG